MDGTAPHNSGSRPALLEPQANADGASMDPGEKVEVNKLVEVVGQAPEAIHEIVGTQSQITELLAKAASWESSFERTGNVECIGKEIECRSRVLSLTPGGYEGRAQALYKLGDSLRRRFIRLGEPADVNKAIEYLTEAMQLMPNGHQSKPGLLIDLGLYYLDRFERLGELSDLGEAIIYGTQGVQLTPDGHAYQLNALNNLGTSYLRRFQCLDELSDVARAIEYYTRVVLLTPEGNEARPARLNNLGNSYLSRFRRLGEPADVDKAIEYQTLAVQLTHEAGAYKSALLSNLGNSYSGRFQRFGKLVDVDQAIDCQTQALLLTPSDHADKPMRLTSLGGSHLLRFMHLGELTDMDKAIEYLAQAALLTPEDHADKPNWLQNLGGAYLTRFERLGELADVDKAIECLVQAVPLTADGHAFKPNQLNTLGISYLSRFERAGEVADVDKAIEYLTQTVLLTPDGHANTPGLLNNLGLSYLRRFERLSNLPDVDKAIECFANAVFLTSDNHAHKQSWLNNLGTSYLRRFQRLGELEDVNKAIDYHTQAMLRAPTGHAAKPNFLTALGNSYRSRFKHLGDLADVDKAIEYSNQAVLLTPDGHADKPRWLNNLGKSYESRYERLGQSSDLESARSSFQHAAQHVVIDAEEQIRCARSWARHSSLHISPQPAYERCIELIPRVIWLGKTINQRYSLLTTISDLAAEAAAWAISVQAYDLAIEWLEQGRSVVWNQILQLRTPFDDLSDLDPALAKRFKSIATQLEGAGTRSTEIPSPSNKQADLERDAQRHRRLAEDWEKALIEARNIPGLENFMRPRKAKELKRSATNGPVILINTHSTRCDALIILPQSNDILHLPLANLSLNKAGELRSQLYSSLTHRGDTARGMRLKAGQPDDLFKKAFVDMWSIIVGPILNALARTPHMPVDELPHVTWCATGALSFLLLHAAGPYDGSSPNGFDLVISSYTPTLSSLLGSSSSIPKPDVGLLVVGQESTPPLPSLPFTVQELEVIEKHVKAIPYLQLNGDQANVDAVLHGMNEHSWVHLACHASQDQSDPAQSAFYLCDGTLTLENITKRQFKDKGLAFLSACQTATGDGKLPDEAVHLAAGMLMAGYPSVIATMWPMCDPDGPKVADRVYAELLEDGKMDHTRAAKALHKAVAELRESLGQSSSERWRWVPFIHIGV